MDEVAKREGSAAQDVVCGGGIPDEGFAYVGNAESIALANRTDLRVEEAKFSNFAAVPCEGRHRSLGVKVMTENTLRAFEVHQKKAFPSPAIDGTSEEQRRRVARIRRAIRRKTNGGVSGLSVKLSEDSLLLSGRCVSFYCKQIAQHAALGFLDGERLVNQIEVAPR